MDEATQAAMENDDGELIPSAGPRHLRDGSILYILHCIEYHPYAARRMLTYEIR